MVQSKFCCGCAAQTTVWTLRNEPSYLDSQYKGNAFNEYNLVFNILGAMGGFSDHPCKYHWPFGLSSDVAVGGWPSSD
jgi:hypothetical protein